MLRKKGKQIIAYALVFCMLLTLPGFTSSATETMDTQHTETETETSAETEPLEERESPASDETQETDLETTQESETVRTDTDAGETDEEMELMEGDGEIKTAATDPVFTVKDMLGNAYEVTQMTGLPETWASTSGSIRPVDYGDGVYTVTVPKGMGSLQIALGDLKNVPEGAKPEDYAGFALLHNSLMTYDGDETIWHLGSEYIGDGMEYSIATKAPDEAKEYFFDTQYVNGSYIPAFDRLHSGHDKGAKRRI